ncbi:hypothetical protein WJX72_011966 [[Myrmecia] bisecta]|uniref:Dolichyl-diphosphooligosaccharide--protein glycosyltransferase subunit DAD1 n=1 Tax=[Myrmecia] bisecta TaxID=41462 RepID=A0AAW1RAM1_9CHLO
MDRLSSIAQSFASEYKKTPVKLRVIDCFILYAALTALVQFAYVVLVGSFPFNAFLAGFLCSVGFLVLTVCLRMQLDPASSTEFKNLSPERAIADFVVCNLLLFLVVWNVMG